MNDELHDPELEAMLGIASGAFPDVNVAYESVRGRVRQAKRRRMMVVSSTACAVLLAGGVLAVQAAGGSDDGTSVADTPTVVVVETSKITEPAESSEATEPTEPTESSGASASSEATETSAAETSEPATTDASSPATTEDRPSTSGGSGQGSSSSSSNPSSTSGSSGGNPKPTVPAGTDKVVTSPGGDITYSLVDGVLSLVGEPRPADGWVVKDQEVEVDRIRVEFTDADHHTTWRVEIRTEGGKAPIETSSRG